MEDELGFLPRDSGECAMKDFLGKPLEIGDTVVMVSPQYRMFNKAKIIAFTKTKVRVEYTNTWNFPRGHPGVVETYLSDSEFLIKVEENK